MKITRIAAGVAGIALIAGSTLLGATAANAADVPVTLPSIPEEASPYAATWFAGSVTGGHGTAVQTPHGLVITGGANGYQLLNGTPASSGVTGTDAVSDYFHAASAIGGDAYFQVSVFGEPSSLVNKQFTTLRPVDANDPYGMWETSQAFGLFTTGTPYILNDLLDGLDAGESAQVLAFGVFVNPGDIVTLRALAYGGDTYYFGAKPTITVSPASLTIADSAKPITVTGSGFTPGELVSLGYGTGSSGDFIDEVLADGDGNVTFTFSFNQATVPVNYTLYLYGDDGVFGVEGVLQVTANVLPATGIDSTLALALGGSLLMGGALVLVAMRRRSAQA